MKIRTSDYLHPSQRTWHPTKIPPGFKLVIDQREKKPLFRQPQKGLEILTKTIKHGDYTVHGFENVMTIERKMKSDLAQYVGIDRERTVVKLEAMAEMRFAALIIEEADPYDTTDYSRITHEVIRGFLKVCRVKYEIHIFWSKSRKELERYILDSLTYAYELIRKV